jgi:hypothetical protein
MSPVGLVPKNDCPGEGQQLYTIKLRILPSFRDGAPHQQTRNCLIEIKKLWALDTKKDCPIDRQS